MKIISGTAASIAVRYSDGHGQTVGQEEDEDRKA